MHIKGLVVDQTVSHWLLIAAALVRARVGSCGICGEKTELGLVIAEYFCFLAKYSIDCSTSIIIRDWYKKPFSGPSNSGIGSTPPPPQNIYIYI